MEKTRLSPVALNAVALAVSAALMLASSACSTVRALPSVEPAGSSTVLVLDYEFLPEQKVLQGAECDLTLKNVDEGTRYSARFPTGIHPLIVGAEPGHYVLQELYCYKDAQWRFRSKYEIDVQAGKINYAGRIKLELVEDERDLSAKIFGPSLKQVGAWFQELAPGDRERVISAHTGKTLSM